MKLLKNKNNLNKRYYFSHKHYFFQKYTDARNKAKVPSGNWQRNMRRELPMIAKLILKDSGNTITQVPEVIDNLL